MNNLPDYVRADSPPAIKNATIKKNSAIAALVPDNLDDTFRLAKALAASGDMIPKHFQEKPEAVMAAIVRGMEIGLAPMQALSSIAVINGRPSIWGDALPALMQRAGHQLDSWIEGEGEKMVAFASLVRGDTGQKILRAFGFSDAKAAGLLGKPGPWQQYRSRMMQMRARSLACRDGAADALMGMYVAEEVQDYPRDVTPAPARVGGFTSKAIEARETVAASEHTQSETHSIDEEQQEQEASKQDAAPVDDAEEVKTAGEVEAEHWTDTVDASEGFPGDDEFTEGAKAHTAALPRNTCPHEDDLTKAASWLAGWDQDERAKS